MTYAMFIDDERFPPEKNVKVVRNWKICRTMQDVVACVSVFGFPNFISFDHDLGEDIPNGKDIANWLIDQDLDGTFQFPDDFDFYVHSQNNNGAANIHSIMTQYLSLKKGNQ